jgi:uncharacterized ferritin-like protein (DUF455 family)
METYLPGDHSRARWMRIDTAEILKRFYFCEREAIIGQAGWLAGIAPFEVKTTLPRFLWEDAMTANALRDRVFELHYPSRLVEIGRDSPLIEIFAESINAPSAPAYILSLARVLKPAMLAAYYEYLDKADDLADGPTLRFMQLAAQEKANQIAVLTRFAGQMFISEPSLLSEAENWVSVLNRALISVGGVSLSPPTPSGQRLEIPGRKEFQLAEVPARDTHFHLCRYYWPDIVDPDFSYGEGSLLQLRSAVSHINEVWAVETGGAILHGFADQLPWEFIFDTARWTYDEARHTRMGYERLRMWGYDSNEIPLGNYIYNSAFGQDLIVRLGMLHYFETKNIGKKTKRAKAFAAYNDKLSQHDMDFDWADETLHAHYGRHWHEVLREKYPERIPEVEVIRARCDQLVAEQVARASDEDRSDIRRLAEAMIAKAERVATMLV